MRLKLLGSFRLEDVQGERIEIRSKRGQALLAMLAISRSGEHSRSWLQEKLWSSRLPEQANASLRRELSNLRKLLNAGAHTVLYSDNGRVWLDLDVLEIDLRQKDLSAKEDFLEGIDIAGEELFEEWLREERAAIDERRGASVAPAAEEIINTGLAEEADEGQIDQRSFSEKPAIAVLPFSCIGSSEDLMQMAMGIGEDLIDCLSRLRWLPVIARSSSFALDDRQNDPQTAGQYLGARYIVDGTLRQENGERVLVATLSDAQNGQSIWSSKIRIPKQSDGNALETMLREITAALGMQIELQEQVQAQRKRQSDLNVNDLIWRGRWHLNRLTADDINIAKQCFEQALRQEPNASEAQIQYAWVHIWNLWLERGAEEDIRYARRLAQNAIIADYDDARGHMLAGIAEIWLKQPLRAEALLYRAIDLNPSLAMAHAQLGSALHLKGEHAKAVSALQRAVRLSPNDHDLFYTYGELAMAHLFLHEWEVALDYAEKSLTRRTSYWLSHVSKIKSLHMLGRKEDAELAWRELMHIKADFKIDYVYWLPFIDSSKHDFLIGALNLSGSRNDQ